MRSSIVISALMGLAAASPMAKRQEIDIDAVEAADTPDVVAAPVNPYANPTAYDGAAVADAAASDPVTTASKAKRDANDCKPEPAGAGFVTTPDTDQAFLANASYNAIANSAYAPGGYSLAYGPANAGVESPSYITYKTLKAYDPIACQQFCDSKDTCYAFNIYIERDPAITPADACRNPSSTVNYKCALFGAQLTNSSFTNVGQWRRDFHVVVSGSMLYNKVAAPADQPGFQSPVPFVGSTNAPDNSYIGMKFFPGAYNVAACTNACTATTDYNRAHPKADGSYNTCSFVNSYVLSKNGVAQGTYCGLYTTTWGPSYAVNYGQYRGSDRYSVSQSYGWSLNQA